MAENVCAIYLNGGGDFEAVIFPESAYEWIMKPYEGDPSEYVYMDKVPEELLGWMNPPDSEDENWDECSVSTGSTDNDRAIHLSTFAKIKFDNEDDAWEYCDMKGHAITEDYEGYIY